MNKERNQLEAELMSVKQELRQCQDDFSSARQSLRERLTNKDQEVRDLIAVYVLIDIQEIIHVLTYSLWEFESMFSKFKLIIRSNRALIKV